MKVTQIQADKNQKGKVEIAFDGKDEGNITDIALALNLAEAIEISGVDAMILTSRTKAIVPHALRHWAQTLAKVIEADQSLRFKDAFADEKKDATK